MRSKFGNVQTEVGGVVFASAREARRWQTLRLLERAGEIRELRRQEPIKIEMNGKWIFTYFADFCYITDGRIIYEDVKSESPEERAVKMQRAKLKGKRAFSTANNPVYRLKMKILKAVGYEIQEV